jgi:hypothetical protein
MNAMTADLLLRCEQTIWKLLNTIPHHLTKHEIEELRALRRRIELARTGL